VDALTAITVPGHGMREGSLEALYDQLVERIDRGAA
jgi:hypothetical protein